MKYMVLLLTAVFNTLSILAQSDDKVYTFVEVMPQFPGGEDSLIKFLSKTLKYPEKEMFEDIQGKVFVQFIINEEGKATSPKILRGVSEGLDKEALRVVPLLPKFSPGINQGKAVKVYYNLPVSFKLGIKYHPNAPVVFDTAVKSNTVILEGDTVYAFTDILSAFPGGDKALVEYITTHTEYPLAELGSGKEGRVYVRFVIDKKGKAIKPVVTKTDYAGFNAEALRVINSLPKFSPGKKANGDPVMSFFTVPVTFRIPSDIIAVVSENASDGQAAQFPGGDVELIKFLQDKIVYPKLERENDISGTAIVSFEVYENGSLGNVRVTKSAGSAGLDNEAMRVVKMLPKFKPGYSNGKATETTYHLPIGFKLQGGEYKTLLLDPGKALRAMEDTAAVFKFVEQQPEFPGGDIELIRFLQKNIRYPTYDHNHDIQGKVMVRFVVDEQGKITDIRVTRGVSEGLDAEAIRVVSSLPDFKPGMQDGKPVKVYFSMPVVFALQ